MTKEELKQEAEEWVQNNNYPYSNCPNIEKKLKQAYLAGAEPREKRIAEIEAQIEKMKCCENCADYDGQDCDADNENYCRCFTGDKNNDCYWRLKED